jgi:hypothetical protein
MYIKAESELGANPSAHAREKNKTGGKRDWGPAPLFKGTLPMA